MGDADLVAFILSAGGTKEVTVRKLQALKFAIIIFLAGHTVGCLFYFIAREYGVGRNTWVHELEIILPFYTKFGTSIAENYLLCIYKGFNALANLEYVHHFPDNPIEIGFCIVTMVLSIWLEGFILGTLLNYMVDRDPAAEAHKRLMEQLAQFVEKKNLTHELSKKLFNHFEFQYQKAVENRATSSVDLPRSLAIKLSECKYRGVIDKCTERGGIFFECDVQFLNALLMKLKVVVYMPNEEVIKKDDLSRELFFVLRGACQVMDDDKVKRVVRDDVPNMAPIFGELAFFLGIVQPMSVRTRPDGDVQLLVISKEDSNDLFNSYPDHHEIICQNLLRSFGLDLNGNEIEQVQNGPEDPDNFVLKGSIKAAIMRQRLDTFAALSFAAISGDVDVVRDLLRRGADIDAVDYDGRSVLAIACYHGSYKVVELLLEEGVNKDAMNRWGKTAMEEAIANRQIPVVELLTQWKAGSNLDGCTGAKLRDAAGRGDIDLLKRLVDSKADVDEGDYDERTALHMAAGSGQIAVVEYLIHCKADVNKEDRWGGTPLQDAVSNGRLHIAHELSTAGATISEAFGKHMSQKAAMDGDVKTLSLLIEQAGLQKDLVDFDKKCPLHRAAQNARLLSVSYLLGIAADPNMQDRWGNTALDIALEGGTLYHMYCARLIHGWGGELGTLKDTERGDALVAEMCRISMKDVRALVNRLCQSKRGQTRHSDQDVLVSREASMQLVSKLSIVKDRIGGEMVLVEEALTCVLEVMKTIRVALVPLLVNSPNAKGFKRGVEKGGDFDVLFQSLEEAIHESERDNDAEAFFAIDSDEEDQLFEELDILMDAQERAAAFRGNTHKFMANSVQTTFRRIFELENAFSLVCDAFRLDGNAENLPVVTSPQHLSQALHMLSVLGVSQYELESMIEDGLNHVLHNAKPDETADPDAATGIPVAALIAGSSKFRQCLLTLRTDPIYCVLCNSKLLDAVSQAQLKRLTEGGRQIETNRTGTEIYSSGKGGVRWFYLLSGKARVSSGKAPAAVKHNGISSESLILEAAGKDLPKEFSFDIGEGDIFGGWGLFEDDKLSHVRVETLEACSYVELQGEPVLSLKETDEDASFRLLAMIRSATWANEEPPRRASAADLNDFEGSANAQVFRKLLRARSTMNQGSAAKLRGLSEVDLHAVKSAFGVIESLWRDLSLGTDHIPVSQLSDIHSYLGELGSELFTKLFINTALSGQISRVQFWDMWMKYLSDDSFYSDAPESAGNQALGSFKQLNNDPDGFQVLHRSAKRTSLYERIHSRWMPTRHLKAHFFDEEILDRYESSYLLVTGELKRPIPASRIPDFLEALFPSFSYPISLYNIKETLDIFGRHGSKSNEIFWADIRKILREHKTSSAAEKSVFIGSTLNPTSWIAQYWFRVVIVVSIYHFIVVPVRIAFVPWQSMLDYRALCTDLVADVITMANVIIQANTAYMSSRSSWVTARSELFRRVDMGYIIAALPLDWFGFLCGASNVLCCWLRLAKMVLIYTTVTTFFRNEARNGSKEASVARRLITLASIVFSIIHFGACVWFYIGIQYQNWNPSHGISWYKVDHKLEAKSYTEHEKWGMREGATVWAQYLTSFYWVATTITSNGLVGDVIPSNLVEVIFCTILMIFNLTLFRYVTGEVSSVVMKADERIIAARTKLEAVETLLKDERIGRELGEEIRGHFRVSQSGTSVDQTAIFSGMSHSLKVEVASCTCREYLDHVPFFHSCSEKLLDAISVLLSEMQFAPEEYIYRAGEIAHEMYFVAAGSVDEVAENEKAGVEKVERVAQQGTSTGEMAFFFGMRHLVGARASKRTGAVCFRLPRAQFLPLLKLFPDEEEKIAGAALTTYDERSTCNRSKRSGSVAQRSQHSGRSKRSSANSKSKKSHGGSIESDVGGGMAADSDSDEENSMDRQGNDSVHDRIEALKQRRRNDRVKMILSAAASGDIETVKQACNSDNIHVFDSLHRTPLHVAASEGKLDIVEFLVASGADVNAEDKFNCSPLNDAVRHRHDDVAKFLRDHNAALNLKNLDAGTLMCKAAHDGDTAEVKRLVDNRISPDAADYDGRTALHLAVCEGHLDVVEFLLRSNANVNCRDRFGGSPLDDAVRHGQVGAQKLLRRAGGQLDTEASALQMCEYAASGNIDGIKALVENGVDISIGCRDDRTAAHIAAANGEISVLDFLLSKTPGVDVNPIDRMGLTPLEDARIHGRNVAVLFLKELGGLPADDPRIDELKKEQEAKRRRDAQRRREKPVERALDESPEVRGAASIDDALLPGLRVMFDKLKSRSKILAKHLDDALPHLQKILRSISPGSSLLLPSSSGTFAHGRGANAIFKPAVAAKSIESLVKILAAFGETASATIQVLSSSEYPRHAALKMASREFFNKASLSRRVLKVCAHVVKKTIRPLQEIRTVTRPRRASMMNLTVDVTYSSGSLGDALTSSPTWRGGGLGLGGQSLGGPSCGDTDALSASLTWRAQGGGGGMQSLGGPGGVVDSDCLKDDDLAVLPRAAADGSGGGAAAAAGALHGGGAGGGGDGGGACAPSPPQRRGRGGESEISMYAGGAEGDGGAVISSSLTYS